MTVLSERDLTRSPLRRLAGWFLVLVLLPVGSGHGRAITGWVENVRLGLNGELIRAKVDTGADNSSLDARNIEMFTRDKQEWVRFTLVGPTGVLTTHELPVVRMARIRGHGLRGHGRPVVALGICLGMYYRIAEVNLTDRSRFDHPLLIGRSFLGADYLVDPASVFLLQPQCKELE